MALEAAAAPVEAYTAAPAEEVEEGTDGHSAKVKQGMSQHSLYTIKRPSKTEEAEESELSHSLPS